MYLSIVIPAFEEADKISHDIDAAAKFLDVNKLEGEIIVVDDGSQDGTSEKAMKTPVPNGIRLNVINCDGHHGKGYAVSMGIKQSAGKYVIFADSGSCIPYENSLKGLELLKNNICDIAHGSRKMVGSNIVKAQSFFRRLYSGLFHWFVVLFMKVPSSLADTQCGFKMYKGDVARLLYNQCRTDGFCFDIEIILRALRNGYRIKEFPVEWTCDLDSRLLPARSARSIIKELYNIRSFIHRKK
jgi:dolichyl-phosphate beta-glucosyltransferase